MIDINAPNTYGMGFMGRTMFKGEISSYKRRFCEIEQPCRRPMVLHKGQPFYKVRRCFVLAQIIAGSPLEFSQKLHFNSRIKFYKLGSFNSVTQDPPCVGLPPESPVFPKIFYKGCKLLPVL